jgi:hypothetical protein
MVGVGLSPVPTIPNLPKKLLVGNQAMGLDLTVRTRLTKPLVRMGPVLYVRAMAPRSLASSNTCIAKGECYGGTTGTIR